MITKAQIINVIRNNVLSDDDVADVQRAINNRNSAKPKQVQANKDWLLEGFVDLLTRRGLIVADGELLRKEAYQTWCKHLPRVLGWLGGLEKTQGLSVNDRPKLALLCAQAMADYLEARDLFKVATMLSQSDRIPEALDCAFPGYISCGLLGMVVRSKAHT